MSTKCTSGLWIVSSTRDISKRPGKRVKGAGKKLHAYFWGATFHILFTKCATLNKLLHCSRWEFQGLFFDFRGLFCAFRGRNRPEPPCNFSLKGSPVHQGNALAHKSVVAMAAVHDCGFELVDHPPYSPDLAPSDYFLFPNMKKKHLARKQYRTDDEVIGLQLRTFFEDQDESSYTTGIQALQSPVE